MSKRRHARPAPPTSARSTRQDSDVQPRAAGRRATWLLALLVVIAGTLAYSTSFRGIFVWDDNEAIVDNPHVKSLWPLRESMSWPDASTVAGRPLAAFTLALNYAIAPADARDVMSAANPLSPPGTNALFYRNLWGYHAFNLTVHLLAGLALAGVVRRSLLGSDRGQTGVRPWSDPGLTPVAFAVALLWVVHPLQTESVTYVIQRVESLMALFYLLTLYCAIRAWQPGPARRWWTTGAIAACFGGMTTKEVMVTAPLIVLLWDWIFGPAVSWRELRERRWPLYLGLALTWIPLGILVAQLPRQAAVGFGYGWTWWTYLVTETAIITHYLRLALIPAPLVFDYGWPPAPSLWSVAPQAALLVALAVATVWLVIKRRPLGFLGAWLFLILAPSSSVLPVATESAAEHRMYLPLAAVLALLVVGLARLVTKVRPVPVRAAAVAGAIVVLSTATTFAWMTRERNRDYWSNERLWAVTVAERPENSRARAVYATALLARGEYAEAERQLREAVRLDQASALAQRNLGIALCATQRTAECITALERAAVLEPASGETHGLLGEAFLSQHQPVRAVEEFQRAIDLMPDNRASRFLLFRTAWLLSTLPDAAARNGGKAVELAERGVRLTGRRDPRMLDALAASYAEVGRFQEAVKTAQEAVAISTQQRDGTLASELSVHITAFMAGQKLRQDVH